MQIIIVTWGTDGDVIPYVSLALELKKAGHEVQLATFSDYQEFVSNHGVQFIPMDWNDCENSFHAILKFRPMRVISSQYNQVRSLKDGLLSELWRVCQNAEVIIFSPSSYPSYYIAEKLGIPCYAVSDKNMQTRVIEMSKQIQTENGVQKAVELFQQYLLSQERILAEHE